MIGQTLAKHRLTRGVQTMAARYLARPFKRKDARRMVIFHAPNRISYSQLYPFLHYEAEIFARYRVEIRCFPFETLLTDPPSQLGDSDIVLLQPWFTIAADDLRRACDHVARAAPRAELSFLDSYAHSDIRLAQYLPDTLRFYFKKSLLKDQTLYKQPWRGDTQITDYYMDLYGLEGNPRDLSPPDHILPKLRLTPNFFTAPHLMPGFAASAPPSQAERRLDIQTRLGVKGAPWYASMRGRSLDIIDAMSGVTTSDKDIVSLPRYMAEMRQSRLCFSPFGYGELCWRDIEAMQTGALLVKQDMGHLQTLPDLYEPGVTYLPVKWDFSDLEEVLRRALEDEALRMRLTKQAYERVAAYLRETRFVDDMAELFTQD